MFHSIAINDTQAEVLADLDCDIYVQHKFLDSWDYQCCMDMVHKGLILMITALVNGELVSMYKLTQTGEASREQHALISINGFVKIITARDKNRLDSMVDVDR